MLTMLPYLFDLGVRMWERVKTHKWSSGPWFLSNDCGTQGMLGTYDMLFKMMDYGSQGSRDFNEYMKTTEPSLPLQKIRHYLVTVTNTYSKCGFNKWEVILSHVSDVLSLHKEPVFDCIKYFATLKDIMTIFTWLLNIMTEIFQLSAKQTDLQISCWKICKNL